MRGLRYILSLQVFVLLRNGLPKGSRVVGGDRNVGRKLGGMLQEAGLEQVDVHVTNC